ncbi:MAG: DUF1192 domain-containing protein [Hyphomicrobiaceae bacterium]
MDWDEPQKRPSREILVGEDLKTLSVTELEARVAALGAEIDRIKQEITSKRSHTSAADALFKKT